MTELSSNDLTPERVTAHLSTKTFGRDYRHLASCRSTNDEVAQAAAKGAPEGLVVSAGTQIAGRGRQGRTWHSPPGENLYVSLLLRPPMPPWRMPPLTLVVGAALAQTIARRGVTPIVKWPNDLLLRIAGETRKLAGVLTEMSSDHERIRYVVVGVGINVNTLTFPPELAASATSLRLGTRRPHDRGELLADFLALLEAAYGKTLTDGPAHALATWRNFADLPQHVRLDRGGDVLEGEAVDLDADGALVIRDEQGLLHQVVSGEIAQAPKSLARLRSP